MGCLVLSLPTREIWRPQRASWTGDSSKSEATSCGVALGLPILSLLEWDKVRGDSGNAQPVTRPQPKEASARKISALSACPSGTVKSTRRGPRPMRWPRKQTLAGRLTSSFITTLRLLSKPYCSPRRLLERCPHGCHHTRHLPGPWPSLKLNQK